MAEGSRKERGERSERRRPCDRRPGWHAQCAHGPAQGVRRTRLRLVHEFRESERPGNARDPQGGPVFPLEIAAPPGASARSGRNRLRRGSRRIFHEPAPRQPHRRLGIEAVTAARKPLCAGEGRRRVHGAACDRRDSTSGLLVRIPHPAAVDRILARPPPSGCTTVSSSAAKRRMAAGRKCGCIPDEKTLPPRLNLPGGQGAGTGCRNRARSHSARPGNGR
jgi:hypothetical protein